jgi:hypothetical protein
MRVAGLKNNARADGWISSGAIGNWFGNDDRAALSLGFEAPVLEARWC